jgi:hypothetical protein
VGRDGDAFVSEVVNQGVMALKFTQDELSRYLPEAKFKFVGMMEGVDAGLEFTDMNPLRLPRAHLILDVNGRAVDVNVHSDDTGDQRYSVLTRNCQRHVALMIDQLDLTY